MPPERFPPDDPPGMAQSRPEQPAAGRQSIPGVYLEDLCFGAQQAAEKAVKAVLVRRGIVFPYVHDLARLLTLLEEAGVEIPEPIRQAEELTRYAILSRYPGLAEPVTEEHYQQALAHAEAVVRWAEGEIG